MEISLHIFLKGYMCRYMEINIFKPEQTHFIYAIKPSIVFKNNEDKNQIKYE